MLQTSYLFLLQSCNVFIRTNPSHAKRKNCKADHKKIHLSFTKNKIQPALGSHLTILLSNKHCHCCRQPDLEWEYRRGSFSYYSTLLSLFFFFLFFIHGWKLLGALGRAPLGNALRTHGSAPGHVLISTWWEVWTKIKILWWIYRINKISFN